MKTFQDITLKDGQPTPPGDLAMELVCKALGICWHDYNWAGIGEEGILICDICEELAPPPNPPLLTSLDAWRELWEGMDERGLIHVQELMDIVDPSTSKRNEHGMYELITGELYLLMVAQPHHHLLAALRTLEDTCGECEGFGWICKVNGLCSYNLKTPGKGCATKDPCEEGKKKCTCNNGKVPLYTIWEARI